MIFNKYENKSYCGNKYCRCINKVKRHLALHEIRNMVSANIVLKTTYVEELTQLMFLAKNELL